ncbi:hypothetical protein N658DRAFT_536108 [Parathielavia hyrcaniae]|uniref:PNPLA domain-containing protein n=1 Tax=Parathielavia hyrcaniae TaxID=113614 RepID=A0AAN6PYK2_9PEZI|nr:hypothetical protein N658DRAFT_536108 [Parathielavia hyrcaniae]
MQDFLARYVCSNPTCEQTVTQENARCCSDCGRGGNGEDDHDSDDDGNFTIYCITCKVADCNLNPCTIDDHETCWNSHLPRNPALARRHRMLNPIFQIMIRAVTHSEENRARQRELYEQDRRARWFHIRQNHARHDPQRNYTGQHGVPILEAHDRFRRVCDPNLSGNAETANHFPRFVSFIGDTCAGKSSLVRAMIMTGLAARAGVSLTGADVTQDASISKLVAALRQRTTEWPVTRSASSDSITNPTTQGVHLYRDEGTALLVAGDSGSSAPNEQRPLLFVDCEGFNAGAARTDVEIHADEGSPETRGRLALPTEANRSRSASVGPSPDYQYRVTAPCYGRNGKDGIDLFYARFLHAISDVIVFVTRDDTKIMPQLQAVLEWASKAVYKSINHPSRKTLIIVRHKSELHKSEFYEEANLAHQYLEGHALLWSTSAVLKDFVEDYNRSERDFRKRIETNQRLYEVLFRKIVCCYVPSKDNPKVRPQSLVRQWVGLRTRIEQAVRDEEGISAAANMKYNVSELSRVLGKAFEHFTTSEEPFDFFLAARRDNPNPETMASHLGNLFRHVYEHREKHAGEHGDVENMTVDVVVASLLTWTFRRFHQGVSPDEVFERSLQPICDAGINEYLTKYESCVYKFPDGSPCVARPERVHLTHASRKGKILSGIFQRRVKWQSGYRQDWVERVRQHYAVAYQEMIRHPSHNISSLDLPSQGDRLRSRRQAFHRNHAAIWAHIKSYKTCFSCLDGIPDHVLACGHSYCACCVQELGTPDTSRESAWLFHECSLCGIAGRGPGAYHIQLKPRCAGVRVLSLDGGGVRGVVELAILEALEKEAGLGVPMREYFDLIVGTSTGGLIALAVAIGPQNNNLEQLTEFFKDAATDTFSQSMIKKFWSRIGIMLFNITDSIYSAVPLQKATKALFGEDTGLFGPALTPGHSQISTRVAVTSSIGYADTMTLITNYNHPQGRNEMREEDDSKDMRVWEAALATSAAPYYLPPFRKTNTGTMYVDGAVFANCPAADAYAETKALWPNRAASLDLLVSLGTGQQTEHRHGGLQNFIPNGIVRTFANMLMHQSNSNESWLKFERSAPSTVQAKLHRLDPPLTGSDRIALDDYAKMDAMIETVNEWAASERGGRASIKHTARVLLASLFFFEPDDSNTPRSSPTTHDPAKNNNNRDHHTRLPLSSGTQQLSGSIRCRLPRDSSGLRRLLTDKVESLASTVVQGRYNPADYETALRAAYWDPLVVDKRTGSSRLADCVDAETGLCHVSVDVTFQDE